MGKCSEQLGNGVEGDARGRGFEGGEHGGRGQRAQAVLVVQRVHGCQQARAVLLALRPVEEVERVQTVGDEAVEMHADEVGLLVVAGPRGAMPTGG